MLVQEQRICWLFLEELQELDHQYLLCRKDQLLRLIEEELEELHGKHEMGAIIRTRRNE